MKADPKPNLPNVTVKLPGLMCLHSCFFFHRTVDEIFFTWHSVKQSYLRSSCTKFTFVRMCVHFLQSHKTRCSCDNLCKTFASLLYVSVRSKTGKCFLRFDVYFYL